MPSSNLICRCAFLLQGFGLLVSWGRTKICVPHLLRPVFFPLLCSFLRHPVSSGFQEWADCVGKGRTLRSNFWPVLTLFGTIHVITALPDVFICSSSSDPHVGFSQLPTSWPVLVACGRVSERDLVCWLQDAAANGPSSSGLAAG